MSERQLQHTYCTDCWLGTGAGTLGVPIYYTVHEVIFCLALSFPSCPLCLFLQGVDGVGEAAMTQSESFQFQCRTKALLFFSFFAFVRVHCLPCCVASATSVHPVACVMTTSNPAGLGCRRGKGGIVAIET